MNFAYSLEQRAYGFSLGTQFGFVHGQAFELVYPGNTMGKYLSELRWDMKPVFYGGLTLDFRLVDIMSRPGFFSSLHFRAGIPGDSGRHENRDWMSFENANLTHFSSHTNKTREFFWLDVKAGVSIPVRSWFYVKPFISGSWKRFAFSGRDGHKIYARISCIHEDGNRRWFCLHEGCGGFFHPIYDDPVTGTFSGDVIRYEQNWFLAAAGFTIGTRVLHPFLFNFSFQISPFTYCAAKDEHLLRNKVFRDYTAWGLFIQPAVNLSFVIHPMELSLGFAYRRIFDTRGPAFASQHGAPFSPAGKAGAALSLVDISFLFRVHLF